MAMLAACATAPPGTPPGGTPAGTAATTTAPAPSAGASASAVAAQTGPVALVNPGFESLVPGRRGDPEGWFTFQHAGPKSYEFVLDTAEPHAGARSLRIRNIGPEPYGAAANSLEVSAYGGKVAHFSGWMRTRDVEGPGAGLTLLLLSRGAIVDQNFMSDKDRHRNHRLDPLRAHAAYPARCRAVGGGRHAARQGHAVARRCRARVRRPVTGSPVQRARWKGTGAGRRAARDRSMR